MLKRGRRALEEYDFPEARSSFEAAFRDSEGGLEAAKALLGLLVDGLGLDVDALVFRDGLSLEARDDPTVCRFLGLAAARSDDEGLARELLARTRQPEAAPAWWELGRGHLADGDHDAVRACAVEIRDLDPAHPGALEFSSDGARILDARRGETREVVDDVQIAGSGRYLWSLLEDREIARVWDLEARRETRRFRETWSLFTVRGDGRELVLRGIHRRGVVVHTPSGHRAPPGEVGATEWPPVAGVIHEHGLLLLESSEDGLRVCDVDEAGRVRSVFDVEDVWAEARSCLIPRVGGAYLGYVSGDDGERLASLSIRGDTIIAEWDRALPRGTAIVIDAKATRGLALRWVAGAARIEDIAEPLSEPEEPETRVFRWPSDMWLYDLAKEPAAVELTRRLHDQPPSRRRAAVEQELGDRPSSRRVAQAASALGAVGDFDGRKSLLALHYQKDPTAELLAAELARPLLVGGELQAARELLEPHTDKIAVAPDGHRVAAVLAQVLLGSGDVEGASAVLRAGLAHGAEREWFEEVLQALEQVYGDDEPTDSALRFSREIVRALHLADERWVEGDLRGVIRGLDPLLDRADEAVGLVSRAAEAWLGLEADTPVAAFRKAEVLSKFIDQFRFGYRDTVPVPAERFDADGLSRLRRRAESWLDALGEGPEIPVLRT